MHKNNDTHSYKGWLNSDSFFKRVFAIFGYSTLGSLLIIIPFYAVFFAILFATIGLSGGFDRGDIIDRMHNSDLENSSSTTK